MRLNILSLVFSVALALTGCVAIPLPPSGPQVGVEKLATIEVGVTTRDQVRALLGEPTILDDERFMITEVEKRAGSVLVIGGFGYQGGSRVFPIKLEHHRVLLALGPEGRIKDAYFRPLAPLPDSEEKASEPPRAALPDMVATAPAPRLLSELAGLVREKGLFGKEVLSPRTFASVAFSPDGRHIAIGTTSEGVLVIDVENGTTRDLAVGSSKNHTGVNASWVRTVAFSPKGRRVAASVAEGAKIWDVATGREVASFKGHGTSGFLRIQTITALAYAADGQTVATGDWNGEIKLWDPETGAQRLSIQTSEKVVTSLAFSPKGAMLASAGWGWPVRIWDTATGRMLGKIDRKRPRMSSLSFSPDGERLIVHQGTHVEIWRMTVAPKVPEESKTAGVHGPGMKLEGVFLPSAQPSRHWGVTKGVAVSPDGRTVAISEGGTFLYRLFERTLTEPFAPQSFAAAFAPDGKSLVTVGRNGAHLWAIDTQASE